ncbi:TonB-dependent receptor [Ferruginibacter sp.]|nr:TonB-dependent receptor [Ferruginibacter sp.]
MKKILSILLLLISLSAAAQKNIKITLKDIDTKEVLINATLKITDSKKILLTNNFGQAEVPANATVEISMVNYVSQTVQVASTAFTVELVLDKSALQDVVVTATRNGLVKRNIPQQVSVVTAKNIAGTGANDLADVLKKTSGVDIIQYPIMLSGVGIRGFRPQFSGLNQRTLLLLDGRPAGATNLAMIDMSNVDRIEIIKGAASALYGSQAMGGVVNVITKKSRGEIKKSVYAGYGSYNTIQAGINAGGSISAKTDFDISLKHFKQKDDIIYGKDNIFRNKFGWTEITNTYRNAAFLTDSVRSFDDKRLDGAVRSYTSYQFTTGSFRLGQNIGKNWRVDAGAEMYSAYDVKSSGDIYEGITNQLTKSQSRYSTYLNTSAVINKHYVSFKIYASKETSDQVPRTSGFVTSKSTSTFSGFQLQDNIKIKNHSVTFGIDRNKSGTTTESWNVTTAIAKAPNRPNYSIYSTAIFANTASSFLNEKLIVTLGVRYDNIDFDVLTTPLLETYKTARKSYGVFSPGFGIKFKAPKNFDIHSSLGRAFVTPDAFNVAGYSISGPGALSSVIGRVTQTSGNVDLKPEKASTFDFGINYFKKEIGLDVDLTLFNTKVADRITTGPTAAVPISPAQKTDEGDTIVSKTTYINADHSNMNGFEFGASFDAGAFHNYDYSLRFFINGTKFFKLTEVVRDLTITTSDVFRTKNITNVANLTLIYGIEYGVKGFVTRLSGRYVGKRFDTDFSDLIKKPEIEYAKFMLLDFSTTIPVRKNDRIIIQVNNITDENYYEKRGWNMPGRNYTVKYSVNL